MKEDRYYQIVEEIFEKHGWDIQNLDYENFKTDLMRDVNNDKGNHESIADNLQQRGYNVSKKVVSDVSKSLSENPPEKFSRIDKAIKSEEDYQNMGNKKGAAIIYQNDKDGTGITFGKAEREIYNSDDGRTKATLEIEGPSIKAAENGPELSFFGTKLSVEKTGECVNGQQIVTKNEFDFGVGIPNIPKIVKGVGGLFGLGSDVSVQSCENKSIIDTQENAQANLAAISQKNTQSEQLNQGIQDDTETATAKQEGVNHTKNMCHEANLETRDSQNQSSENVFKMEETDTSLKDILANSEHSQKETANACDATNYNLNKADDLKNATKANGEQVSSNNNEAHNKEHQAANTKDNVESNTNATSENKSTINDFKANAEGVSKEAKDGLAKVNDNLNASKEANQDIKGDVEASDKDTKEIEAKQQEGEEAKHNAAAKAIEMEYNKEQAQKDAEAAQSAEHETSVEQSRGNEMAGEREVDTPDHDADHDVDNNSLDV